MSKKHNLFLFCFALLPYQYLTAQQPYFQEENFQLPASEINLVNGIVADVNNCIWFTTQTGVYRYDGSRFRHYSVLNTSALKFERMAGIPQLMDNNGFGWCIQDGKGNMYRIDSQSRIQPIPAGINQQIVYSTTSFPLQVFPADRRVNPLIRANIQQVHSMRSNKRLFLSLSTDEIISMNTRELLNGGVGTVIYHSQNKDRGSKLLATTDHFYFISETSMLCWDKDALKPRPAVITGDIINDEQVVNYERLKMFYTAAPNLFLFWHDGDIYEVKEDPGTGILDTKLLVKQPGKEQPTALFYSPAQQIFIGYYLNKGLIFYRPRQFSLLSYQEPGVTAGDEDYYYSLIPADSGLVTINNAGLVWLGKNGSSRILSKEDCSRYFLFKDKGGNTWYQKKQGEYLQFLQAGTGQPVPVISLTANKVFTGMYQQDDSTFFVLTNTSFIKMIFTGKVNSFKLLYALPPGTEFNMLYPLNDRTFWVGSDRGLMQYDVADNKMKKMPELSNVYVRAAIKLAENNYLLGTFDKGIYQFNNNKWTHLSSAEKGMPASAHAFIIDEKTSSVWVSSNEGIIRMPLQQLLKKNVDETGHVQFGHFTSFGPGISAEFNGSSNVSAAKLSDTCLAFSNAKGIVIFNPQKIISPPLPVNVLVESLNEYGSDVPVVPDRDLYELQFRPVVPYFGNRGDLEVLYRLTNTDNNWHKLPPNSFINYNSLTPGNHKLQFRLRYYNDPEGKEVFLTARDFDVPYRWYQKTWFRITAIVLILLVLILLHNIRIWYILKKKKQLQELVDQKTKELQETNDNNVEVIKELSASEANLKQSNFLKSEYYSVLTHDLRSPLKFLSFNINQLLEQMPGQEDAPLKKGLFAAYECSNEVHKLIEEFVCWIQDNENQLKINPDKVIINNVITEVKKVYGLAIDGNKNVLNTTIPGDLSFTTDPKLLFVILRNAIDNANKYTQHGSITVSAVSADDHLELSVADTGRGMNPELVQELIGLQQQQGQLRYKQRKSLGFYIMCILTQKLGGSYSISSTKERGTTLSFKFPFLGRE